MHRHAIECSRLIHNKSVKYNTILHHNYNTNNSPYSYHIIVHTVTTVYHKKIGNQRRQGYCYVCHWMFST